MTEQKPKGIELTFTHRSKTHQYIIAGELRQWVVHRAVPCIDKKTGEEYTKWSNENSYYGRIDQMFKGLREEVPRRFVPETWKELLELTQKVDEKLRDALLLEWPVLGVKA